MTTPIQERQCCEEILAELKNLDNNGWCAATDGTLDDLSDEDAIAALRETVASYCSPSQLEWDALRALRSRGFAVIVFCPGELQGVEPRYVEEAIVTDAWAVIDALK